MTDVGKEIERIHRDLCRDAQTDYDREMKAARRKMEVVRRRVRAAEKAFRDRQAVAAANQKEACQRAQKWREQAIASARRLTNANADTDG